MPEKFRENFIFRGLIPPVNKNNEMSESYNAIEPGPGQLCSHLPLSGQFRAELQHILGVDFLQGHVYVVDEAGLLEGFRWFYWVED